MKVFWSWQSDTPGNIGRHFVRDALKAAIEQLKTDPDIVEPSEREARNALHVDHDRQGVPGSPDLVRTILEKIDASSVVVCDGILGTRHEFEMINRPQLLPCLMAPGVWRAPVALAKDLPI